MKNINIEDLKILCSDWKKNAKLHRFFCAKEERDGYKNYAETHRQQATDIESCVKQLEALIQGV